jgi:hypothetical protein
MRHRLFCNPVQPRPATSWPRASWIWLATCMLLCISPAAAGDAPQWMHAVANVPLPAYDEKTDAVLLYSETNLDVLSANKIRTRVREAYKVLRPQGREHGTVFVPVNSLRKLTGLHGWCIPEHGKDFEVKEKDAVEMSPPGVAGSELITDLKAKVLHIPAPDPGNIIGYEYELEEQPPVLQDAWYFQETDPVRESHYSLQLPSDWEFKTWWLHFSEVKPVAMDHQQHQWDPKRTPYASLARSLGPNDRVVFPARWTRGQKRFCQLGRYGELV